MVQSDAAQKSRWTSPNPGEASYVLGDSFF